MLKFMLCPPDQWFSNFVLAENLFLQVKYYPKCNIVCKIAEYICSGLGSGSDLLATSDSSHWDALQSLLGLLKAQHKNSVPNSSLIRLYQRIIPILYIPTEPKTDLLAFSTYHMQRCMFHSYN